MLDSAVKYSGQVTNSYYHGYCYNTIYNQQKTNLNPEREHYMLVFTDMSYFHQSYNLEINTIKVILP